MGEITFRERGGTDIVFPFAFYIFRAEVAFVCSFPPNFNKKMVISPDSLPLPKADTWTTTLNKRERPELLLFPKNTPVKVNSQDQKVDKLAGTIFHRFSTSSMP
jgi:hypothetical protein